MDPWREEPPDVPVTVTIEGSGYWDDKRRIRMNSNITTRVLALVSEQIAGDHRKRRATAETPLLSHGLDLDSVAVLQLIMAVEGEFGVRFDDLELSVDMFKTSATLADAVARKLSANGADPGA
jgi:acyl carrier protein